MGHVDTGIGFETLYPGLVAEIEEREAALFNGYTWKEWGDLNRRERVIGIAHRRTNFLIDAHRNDALTKDAESRRRRKEG